MTPDLEADSARVEGIHTPVLPGTAHVVGRPPSCLEVVEHEVDGAHSWSTT